jgi:outer membrane protein
MRCRLFLHGGFWVVFGSSALAGQADVRVGLDYWHQQYDARARAGGDYIDLDSVFDIDKENDFRFYLAADLDTPWAPHLEVSYTRASTDGDGTLFTTIFDHITFEGDVVGELSLDHTEITIGYDIYEGPVDVDIGFALRFFDAEVILTNEQGRSGRLAIDDTVPLLYGKVDYALPGRGMSMRADGRFIKYADDEVLDLRLALRWQAPASLGLELGYRYMDIDYGLSGGLLEATVEGLYGGIFWQF